VLNFRDHPLLSFAGRHSWPPIWTWIGGARDRYLRGEIGVLKEVRLSERPAKKCFLVIEHETALYMGCVLIADHPFREQVFELLTKHRGYSIEAIGGLDVTHLL
jgi:hypothetical protein